MATIPPAEDPEQARSAAPNGTHPEASSATAQPSSAAAVAPEAAALAPGVDKAQTHKDVSLKDFMAKMDDYAPIIPDAVTNYYMTRAGLPPPPQTDPRLARLLALATQKFVADVAADAYQYSRVRASNTSAGNAMGNLGAAAGFPIPGHHHHHQAGGGGGAQGGAGAATVAGKDQGSKGGALGIQRPGFGGGGGGNAQNRTVLTMEDLGMAVGEFGANIKRSEFYR